MMEYTELLNLIKSRRSIREFTAQSVKREDILRILEAARWAPSNHNRQPWKFLVFEDAQKIRDLAECVRAHLSAKLKALPAIAADYANEMIEYATFFAQAPVLIVGLHKRPISASASVLEGVSNPSLVSGEPLSVAMAVQNLLLAAQTLGLGTCVLTGPLLVDQAVMEHLKIPPGLDLNGLISLGYPNVKPEPPRRKDLQQILEFR
jgi:nitroreductase